jgi:two-component system sensor histidine kinase AlgZ
VNQLRDALPDFRNLGVVARILVIVNLAALVAAAIRAPTFALLTNAFVEIALVVEPVLLASLCLLWGANAWLAKLSYWTGLAVVAVGVMWLTAGVEWLRASVDVEGLGIIRAGSFALLVTAFLAGYFHLRNRAFSPALVEARLQALQARIRPHFLFNTLNAVLSLIRKDPKRAEHALEDLADLYRMVMAEAADLTTLEREIELAREYLNLEQLRLGPRLAVEWKIEDAPRDALVPPLLLQPLVENAVYHGIEPGLAPGAIEIEIRREKDRLHVKLTNPYHPEHQHRQGNRMALANIRERLLLHFDVEAELATAVNGPNFEIRMVMPYRKGAPDSASGGRAAAERVVAETAEHTASTEKTG